MPATVTFFPVDNGDMTLIVTDSGRRVLIDINIREPGEDVPDVAKDLRNLLKKDGKGRPYVDAFLLSHPDQDHVRGLQKHFHLGPLSDYAEPKNDEPGKMVIREMWSSPMVFRRASKKAGFTLCDDAKAWQKEARRRVNLYKSKKKGERTFVDGDHIQIMGEDEDGKTEDIIEIVVKVGDPVTKIVGVKDSSISGLLLAPMPKGTDDEEDVRTKNNSSVIIRFSIACGQVADACKFLSGGDAEVAIWERIWKDNKASNLEYDLMQTPHHCSWHSLSADSWSDLKEKVKVSPDARSALGQAIGGAYIIASSKAISDADSDPPCIRAKREYQAIAKEAKGSFIWVGEKSPDPLQFEITSNGPRIKTKLLKATAVVGGGSIGSTPLPHGV